MKNWSNWITSSISRWWKAKTPPVNKSGLKPVGHAVLCKPYEPEFQRTMIAIPDHVRAKELMGEMRGLVLELGASCYDDEPARCEAGDKVLINKYSGCIVHGSADNELYRMCNDEDIFCLIEVGELENVAIEDPAKALAAERRAAKTA